MIIVVLLSFVLIYFAIEKYDKYTAKNSSISTFSKMGLLYLIFVCPIVGYAVMSYKAK